MIIHLVCLLMLVMVRLMVSNDDVLRLLLSSVPAGEFRAQPAETGEAALVNLTEEAEVHQTALYEARQPQVATASQPSAGAPRS